MYNTYSHIKIYAQISVYTQVQFWLGILTGNKSFLYQLFSIKMPMILLEMKLRGYCGKHSSELS